MRTQRSPSIPCNPEQRHQVRLIDGFGGTVIEAHPFAAKTAKKIPRKIIWRALTLDEEAALLDGDEAAYTGGLSMHAHNHANRAEGGDHSHRSSDPHHPVRCPARVHSRPSAKSKTKENCEHHQAKRRKHTRHAADQH
jgi:hypothetical protein